MTSALGDRVVAVSLTPPVNHVVGYDDVVALFVVAGHGILRWLSGTLGQRRSSGDRDDRLTSSTACPLPLPQDLVVDTACW